MRLEKHGLKILTPEIAVTSFTPDGRALSLYKDARRSAEQIAEFSQKDGQISRLQASLVKMGKVIGEALALAAPNIDNPSRGDLWGMLRLVDPSASWARKICIACYAGGQQQSLMWWRSILRPNCCEPPSQLVEFSGHSSARGQPEARWFFSFVRLVILIPAGSSYFAEGGIGAVTQAMAAAATQQARKFAAARK